MDIILIIGFKEVIKINKLKNLRLNNGLSQTELGNILGLKKNTICQYETGKRRPSIPILQKLAAYFNCTIDDLIGESSDAG